jgi:hypothetical protein
MEEDEELGEIARWFAKRGFELRMAREGGVQMWADLARLPAGNVVAPRYGRGDPEIDVARRAQEDYTKEQ